MSKLLNKICDMELAGLQNLYHIYSSRIEPRQSKYMDTFSVDMGASPSSRLSFYSHVMIYSISD